MDDQDRDERRITRKERRRQLKAQRLMEHTRQALSTVAGRAVLWEILQLCRLNATSYNPDMNLTMRYEGRRDVGLDILGLLDTAKPGIYAELMEQARAFDDREQEETEEDGRE